MALRLIQAPWTQQPQGAVGVDWSNPLSNGLAALVTPSISAEMIGGAQRVVLGGFSVGVGDRGIAAKGPLTQVPGCVHYACNAVITGDFSILLFASAGSGTPSTLATHDWPSSGGLSYTSASIAISGIRLALDGNFTDSVAVAMDVPRVVIGTRVENTQRVYIDGSLRKSAITGTRTGTITGLTMGRDLNVSNNPDPTSTYLQAVWCRALSDAEIASLSANPWQLFAPQRIWVPVAAGGGADTALQATATVTASASASLTTAIPLAASATASASASAALTTSIALAASASASASASGALTTAIHLAASASGSVTATADLSTSPAGLSATASVGVTATASLTTSIRLAAAATAQAQAEAALTTAIALQADAVAAVTADAELTSESVTPLAAAAIATAQASATLTTAIALQAIATAQCTASAVLDGGSSDGVVSYPGAGTGPVSQRSRPAANPRERGARQVQMHNQRAIAALMAIVSALD